MSLVDVVVPCYNYGRYLARCVDSVLSQRDVELRVLIINDASSDDTAAVAEGLATRDSRVRVRNHPVNRGNIATYNEGIAEIEGDYFLLLSADDWLTPGALSRAVKSMRDDPHVVLTCGRAAVAHPGNPDPVVPDQRGAVRAEVLSGTRFIEKACSNPGSPLVCTPTAIVRASTQRSVGGYSAHLPHAGDLEMWLRFACHGSIATLDACQAVYRKHESNMHYSFGGIENLRQHALAFESAFRSLGDRIPEAGRFTRMYRMSFARRAMRMAGSSLKCGHAEVCRDYVAFAVDMCVRGVMPFRHPSGIEQGTPGTGFYKGDEG